MKSTMIGTPATERERRLFEENEGLQLRATHFRLLFYVACCVCALMLIWGTSLNIKLQIAQADSSRAIMDLAVPGDRGYVATDQISHCPDGGWSISPFAKVYLNPPESFTQVSLDKWTDGTIHLVFHDREMWVSGKTNSHLSSQPSTSDVPIVQGD